jgi:Zn-finger nucleic acid-binding protein
VSTCPLCEISLDVIDYQGHELVQCLRCQGFWFPNEQFREIKHLGFAGLCADVSDGQSPPAAAEEGAPAELTCPDCADQTLAAYNYAYSSDIQLHRCPMCKGIWARPHALRDIDALLTNYQESLEDAKAKAVPLMMEVKRQFKEQEEVREAERRQKKRGIMGNLFRKKRPNVQTPVDIFANLSDQVKTLVMAESGIETDGYKVASRDDASRCDGSTDHVSKTETADSARKNR